MNLRKLKREDAALMLEWMHDPSVVENLQADFAAKTIEDCLRFIHYANTSQQDIHMAVTDDSDTYMGTVSLKHIKNSCTEFAITVRNVAMGKGYSWYGMKEIIQKAFKEYDVHTVYWCVSRENKRAVRFYDKHHFQEAEYVPAEMLARYTDMVNLKWYSIQKDTWAY